MEMILITYPEVLEGEHELITECFERGLENLHIRKYGATEQELLDLLKRIPPDHHSRIVLHHHHYLVRSFELKGVHFNSYAKGVEDFPKGQLLFSRAVHELEELYKIEPLVDRVLLSPVFPTLSKETDRRPIPAEWIEKSLKENSHHFQRIALGGVTPERIEEIDRMGFEGFAVLGGIWNSFCHGGKEKALERFEAYRKAQEACEKQE